MGSAVPWRNSPDERRRSNATYGSDWRRKRNAAMAAARGRCQIRLPGCIGAATEVDHIDGAANDPQHQRLRAACKPCHATVTAAQGNAAKGERGPADPTVQARTAW